VNVSENPSSMVLADDLTGNSKMDTYTYIYTHMYIYTFIHIYTYTYMYTYSGGHW